MFVSTLGFLSDGEDRDSRSTQVIEMDLPQLGVGEESFHHRDERQGKQFSFDGAVASIVEMESILPFSGCSVMSHLEVGSLCPES